jgi:hypothetical protein
MRVAPIELLDSRVTGQQRITIFHDRSVRLRENDFEEGGELSGCGNAPEAEMIVTCGNDENLKAGKPE